MRIVGITEARNNLSRLIEQGAQGEAFVIAKSGKPLVKVTALEPADTNPARRLGFMNGQIAVPDDFDRMGGEEIERIFGV